MPTAPLADLDVESVENVYVFLADAVRYDERPDRVAERGLTFECVAGATCTPQSLPTIVAGRHPPNHGVTWFRDRLPPDLPTLFDLPGIAGGYAELVWRGEALRSVLDDPPDVGLASAEPPFVVVEHDNGGHAPYVGMEELTAGECFRRIDSREELRLRYRETVAASTDRFERRLAVLEDRGLLEETLVVYLADHGELLGEHGGFVGHVQPMTPELVSVPATFVHPSLSAGEEGEHLLQGVDLYPTAVDVLRGERSPSDGEPLTRPVERDRPAYARGVAPTPGRLADTPFDPGYESRGIWTREGGHVFVTNPRPVRLFAAAYEALAPGHTGAFGAARGSVGTFRRVGGHYLRNYHRYGDPAIPTERARAFVEELGSGAVEAGTAPLSLETRERLEHLGYR